MTRPDAAASDLFREVFAGGFSEFLAQTGIAPSVTQTKSRGWPQNPHLRPLFRSRVTKKQPDFRSDTMKVMAGAGADGEGWHAGAKRPTPGLRVAGILAAETGRSAQEPPVWGLHCAGGGIRQGVGSKISFGANIPHGFIISISFFPFLTKSGKKWAPAKEKRNSRAWIANKKVCYRHPLRRGPVLLPLSGV